MKIETRPIPGLQPEVGCSIWLPHGTQQHLFVEQPGQPLVRYGLHLNTWVPAVGEITDAERQGLSHRIHREDPVAYLAELEEIDNCVYHQSPLDEEELGMDTLSHFRKLQDGLEIWTVEEPATMEGAGLANVVFLHSDSDLDDTPGNILRWYLFNHYYDSNRRELSESSIALEGMGGWSIMRTVYIDWLEIYDHEHGFERVAEAMQVIQSVLTHRRNIHHCHDNPY